LKLGEISATASVSRDKHTYGFTASHNSASEAPFSFAAGAESKVNDNTTIKTKIDNNLNLAVALKKKVNDTFTLTGSTNLKLKET
jgi:hypothetical protein